MVRMLIDKFRLLRASPLEKAKLYQRKGVVMGKECQVFDNCSFGSEPYLIQLGDKVKVTYGCRFITHDGGVEVIRNIREDLKKIDAFGRIVVGNNVFFGNNCIILPNVTIGDNVIIGAGSIVTKSFPSNVIIGGVPAKIIKTLDEYIDNVITKMVFTKHMSYQEKKDFLTDKFNLK